MVHCTRHPPHTAHPNFVNCTMPTFAQCTQSTILTSAHFTTTHVAPCALHILHAVQCTVSPCTLCTLRTWNIFDSHNAICTLHCTPNTQHSAHRALCTVHSSRYTMHRLHTVNIARCATKHTAHHAHGTLAHCALCTLHIVCSAHYTHHELVGKEDCTPYTKHSAYREGVGLVDRKLGVENLAFQFGRQISHAALSRLAGAQSVGHRGCGAVYRAPMPMPASHPLRSAWRASTARSCP